MLANSAHLRTFRTVEFVGTARRGKPRLYGNLDFASLFREVLAGGDVVKIIETQAEEFAGKFFR